MAYFTELGEMFQKLIWNHKRPKIATAILRKKNKVVGITLPDIELYYKVIVIKTAWYLHENRHVDQWNRIKSPEINPCPYVQLIFDKGVTNIRWSKNSLFSQSCWENWNGTYKKHETRPPTQEYTRINSR